MKKIFVFISVAVLSAASLFAKESLVVLRSKSALYEAINSQTVKFSEEILAGTVLDKVSAGEISMDIQAQGRIGHGTDFYAVNYKGKDYFIPSSDSVIVGSSKNIGITVKDAVIFTKPHPAFFKNSWLETCKIVVIIDNPNKIFSEVMFFDIKSDSLQTQYIQTSKISKNSSDIKAAQILDKARSEKDAEVQKGLLDEASKAASSGSGKLTSYVNSAVNEILGVSSFSDDDIVQIDEFSAHVHTEDGAKINLRSMPGTAGEKITQVENGWECSSSLATESTETIDGITASWYYVQNGEIEGWIFGGYLKKEE